MTQHFTPPTRRLPFDQSGKRWGLWPKVRYDIGQAVAKFSSGAYRTYDTVDPNLADVTQWYVGGHTYAVSDAEAADLSAAGYGSYLSPV